MPWLYGILTLALMTAAICVILHLLSIRSRLLQVLLRQRRRTLSTLFSLR